MEIQLVLHLPRDAVSVPVGRQVLDSCLQTIGVTADTRSDIALALSEACANVILHAGPGDEYEVRVSARDERCAIEVVNTASGREEFAIADEPVPATAEHGRGLKIIEAITDNVQLTGDERAGTTLHFEKTLEWVPEATGRQLFKSEQASAR